MREITLGSLFDGLGGFPLAGIRNGIRPVWASDIEPFPIAVTRNHFPNMRHVGSVTEISGAELEPVDIITFGSPCQDLSVAGKQAGIHDGVRSSLFFQAVRIIKEMREKDIADGRADQFIRPRFAVWENVPGAFSSNKGQDFQAVLQALCDIRGGQSHIVPLPPNGKWLPAGNIVGNGFSLAWRVLDAAGWGVPQRRKRIFLVADFAGERAAEILFDENRLHGHPAPSGEAGQGTAADAQGSAGRSSRAVQCLNPWDCESKRQYEVGGVYRTLDAGNGAGGQAHGVCYSPAAFMGGQGAKAGSIAYADDGSTPTLKSVPSGGNTVPDVVYPINTMVATRGGADDGRTTFGVGEANDPQFTLGAAHEHAVCYALDATSSNSMKSSNPHSGFHEETVAKTLNTTTDPTCNQGGNVIVQPVAIEGNGTRESHEGPGYAESDVMYTLNTIERHAVCYGIDQQGGKGNASYQTDVMPTLCSDSHGTPHAVCFQQNQREEVRDMGNQAGALTAEPGMHNSNYVCFRKSSKPEADGSGERWVEDEKTNTLNTFEFHSEVRTPELVCYGVDCRNAKHGGGVRKASSSRIYDARGNGDGETIPTLTGDHENRITDYTALCVERKVDE